MKRIILTILLALPTFAAVPGGAIWTIDAAQTATGNVTGGFFNPGNTNFFTDGTTDANTANTASPVFSSASYNFVAGDVGAWLYIKSGTNTFPGWYQIASVASNKATLTATIGTGVLHNATNRTYTASTAAGIASVGTPTGITWGIDFSQSASGSITSNADLASTNATTTCTVTSSLAPFSARFVGNAVRISAGTSWTTGWYEIQSVSGSTATLDRACGSSASVSGGTFRVGGALSLASSDDAVFESGTPGNDWLVKNGTYAIGGTVSITVGVGGASNPIRIIGYNSLRGDNPTGSTRPVFNSAGNLFTFGNNWDTAYMQFTGSSATGTVQLGTNSRAWFSKFTNTSTTANSVAVAAGSDNLLVGVEAVAYRGRALNSSSANLQIIGGYFHDSDVCVRSSSTNSAVTVERSIMAGCVTAAVNIAAANTSVVFINNNTLYGAENNLGTGVSIVTGATDIRVTNNIIKGFATGVSHADVQSVGFDAYNVYHGNTTDVTNWAFGPGSITGTDPAFTSVTQVTGTGGTSSTNVLTAASGTPFATGLTDNVDFLTIISGTGTGLTNNTKYLITSHTNNTVTVSSNITSSGSGSSIVWEVTEGHNFAIGAAVKGIGYPGIFPGALSTSYVTPGAVSPNTSGGSGGTRIY